MERVGAMFRSFEMAYFSAPFVFALLLIANKLVVVKVVSFVFDSLCRMVGIEFINKQNNNAQQFDHDHNP